jgi:membrane associated rhomboid family serine protease
MTDVITLIIIVATVLVSINAFGNPDFKFKMLFYPYKVKNNNEFYRFFSHMLIHGDYMHLFFNMFVLYSFGSLLEATLNFHYGALGSFHFIILYVAGGGVAAQWPYFRNQDNIHYMSLGASGAVSAVLFATILWYPEGGIYLMFIPFEIPSWVFGILYLGFEYYMGKKGTGRVAHDAHFGGAVFGIVYVLIIHHQKGIEFLQLVGGKLGFV